MRKFSWVILVIFVAFAGFQCATPSEKGASATHGARGAAMGIANLVLAPFQIAAGIAEGLAFLPYTIATGAYEINQALIKANAVTLEDTYQVLYGKSLNSPDVEQKTGQVGGFSMRSELGNMNQWTVKFRQLLMSKGMPASTAEHYVICSIDTATVWKGHQLLAVVYRYQTGAYTTLSKHTQIKTTFQPSQSGWYEPYQGDADGQIIDEVVDWIGVERKLLESHKTTAFLMALAAEAVKTGKRSPDYWEQERRWIAGQTSEVIQYCQNKVHLAQEEGTATPRTPQI